MVCFICKSVAVIAARAHYPLALWQLPPTLCVNTCTVGHFALQAAFKYWLVLVIVFEVTLVIMYAEPAIRPLNPAFGFVAASLAMSEKVEATVSKVRLAVATINWLYPLAQICTYADPISSTHMCMHMLC